MANGCHHGEKLPVEGTVINLSLVELCRKSLAAAKPDLLRFWMTAQTWVAEMSLTNEISAPVAGCTRTASEERAPLAKAKEATIASAVDPLDRPSGPWSGVALYMLRWNETYKS